MELNEDLVFQRRWWKLERVSWFLGFLVIAGALGGLTGNGPLAQTIRGTDSGDFQLTYSKVARRMAPQQVIVLVQHFPREKPLTFRVSGSLSKNLEIIATIPAPASTSSDAQDIELAFLPAAGTSAMQIIFDVEAKTAGFLRGAIQYAGQTIEMNQFVWP